MRLELGSRVDCADETFGKLVDVVIDPTSRRVTHLVVEPDGDPALARLVPVELAQPADHARAAVALRATAGDVRRLPPVREAAYLRLGQFPVDDPDWDVGIEEVLALPYYYPTSYDLEPEPLDFAVTYDRVPKGEIEIRRASSVESADGREVGTVDGFVLDDSRQITHLVLERGRPWDRREIAIPIAAVARVDNDAVTLTLTLDETDALPHVAVRRWPRTIEHDNPRR